MKTVRRPPYPKWNPGYFPCSSLIPLPLSSRRPSVSFGGFGLRNNLVVQQIRQFGANAKPKLLAFSRRLLLFLKRWGIATCLVITGAAAALAFTGDQVGFHGMLIALAGSVLALIAATGEGNKLSALSTAVVGLGVYCGLAHFIGVNPVDSGFLRDMANLIVIASVSALVIAIFWTLIRGGNPGK